LLMRAKAGTRGGCRGTPSSGTLVPGADYGVDRASAHLDACSRVAETCDVQSPAGTPDLGLPSPPGHREGKIMAEHPNVARIRDGYTAFAKGDFAVLTDLFAEDLLWHDSGRNQLSGDYRGREAVFGLFGKLMEVTEGSFRIDLRAVFADDAR